MIVHCRYIGVDFYYHYYDFGTILFRTVVHRDCCCKLWLLWVLSMRQIAWDVSRRTGRGRHFRRCVTFSIEIVANFLLPSRFHRDAPQPCQGCERLHPQHRQKPGVSCEGGSVIYHHYTEHSCTLHRILGRGDHSCTGSREERITF